MPTMDKAKATKKAADPVIAGAIARKELPSEIVRRAAENADNAGEDDADAQPENSNLFAAFWLDPTTAAAIAIPGGQPLETLHLTLALVPDGALMGELVTARALVDASSRLGWSSALKGRVSGYGRFAATDSSDGRDVFVALVDVPGLEDIAEAIEDALEGVGLECSDDHGFQPHITLKYLEPGEASPFDTGPLPALSFNEVTWINGTRQTVIPIGTMADGWGYYSEGGTAADLMMVAKHGSQFRLFVEQPKTFSLERLLSEDGEWVQVLPKPGLHHHQLWGDIAITSERNAEFVSNFNNKIYQETIPVDAEHQTKLGGAFGYVKEMRQDADGGASARIELTERGKTIMARDGFKYVSPEWYEEWEQPETGTVYHNVLIAVAFTNNPYFKERYGAMRPILAASERLSVGQFARNSTSGGVSLVFNEIPHDGEGVRTMADENKGTAKAAAETAPITLSADDAKAFAEFKAGRDTQAQAFKDLEEKVNGLVTTNAELRTQAMTARFTATARGFMGDRDDHVQQMVDLATAFGEDSEQYKRYVKSQKAQAALFAEQNPDGTNKLFAEHGSDFDADDGAHPRASTDAVAEALRLAKEITTAEPKVTQGEALNRVFQENQQLYNAYTKQTNVKVGRRS